MRLIAPLASLALAALACGGFGAPPTLTPGGVETKVAATLTALAPFAVSTATATPPPASTTAAPPTEPASTSTATAAAPALFACAVAYADSASLFCLGDDGTPQLLVTAEGGPQIYQPRISPDGRLVAYQLAQPEGGPSELWVVGADSDSGPARRLVSAAHIPNPDPSNTNSPSHFEWRAGTHTLMFDTDFVPAGGRQGPGEYLNGDLWSVDADGGTLALLLPAGSGGAFAISPDGGFIAISRPQGLDLVNADGTNYQRDLISFPSINTASEYAFKPAPVWGPDSTFFSVAIPSPEPSAADTSVALYRVGVDGIVQPLATLQGNFVYGGLIHPDLSPDGQHALYSVTVPDQGGVESLRLVTLSSDLEDREVARPISPVGLGWAPDGNHYAYSSVPNGTLGSGYALGLDGTLQPFAPSLNAMLTLRWLDPNAVVFIAKLNNGDWSLYRQALGAEPALLAGGLTQQAGLDVR